MSRTGLAPRADLDRTMTSWVGVKPDGKMSDWVRFEPGGRVQVRNGKVELGQGIGTAIAQIAADELGVPLDVLDLVSGDTGLCPNEWWTSASISIERGGLAVRIACAEVARAASRSLLKFEGGGSTGPGRKIGVLNPKGTADEGHCQQDAAPPRGDDGAGDIRRDDRRSGDAA